MTKADATFYFDNDLTIPVDKGSLIMAAPKNGVRSRQICIIGECSSMVNMCWVSYSGLHAYLEELKDIVIIYRSKYEGEGGLVLVKPVEIIREEPLIVQVERTINSVSAKITNFFRLLLEEE